MTAVPDRRHDAAPVEQIKLKRAGVGLRAHDLQRACPGFTLFTPLTGERTVYLIGLDGGVVHTWEMPYPPGLYGYLTDAGTLLYNGKVLDRTASRFIETQPWKGGAVLEADWRGRILWEVRHPDHHHDAMRLRNGNVLLLCMAPIPADLARRVQGGLPGTEHHGEMYGDYVVEMSTAGEAVWEWRSWEHLDPETDRITPQDRRHEWTHANTVAELPDGNIVLSFRDISTIVIVDRRSGRIVWKLGPPALAQQHAPSPLPNGNLLIFDNGTHRIDHPVPHSRVIEVDPATKEIVWSYRERRLFDFFSPYISNAQRLPNGNTLICEGNFGRLFEVTPDGQVVWEYVNPYFAKPAGQPDAAEQNSVFRAYRYSPERIALARSTAD
ncbi:MAG TPA: aryl-sulfate sulfotransferase [bacterium]|nr:aryl-sulfate sulfotransferase [bacterium]